MDFQRNAAKHLAKPAPISILCKKLSHTYDESVVNPNRKRKSEGMHPEIEKALLIWEMHAQRVNVSSKIINEMGIRILDEVNEILYVRMKRKFIYLFLTGHL